MRRMTASHTVRMPSEVRPEDDLIIFTDTETIVVQDGAAECGMSWLARLSAVIYWIECRIRPMKGADL